LHHEVFGEVAFARPVVAGVESSDVFGKLKVLIGLRKSAIVTSLILRPACIRANDNTLRLERPLGVLHEVASGNPYE
jgi:hypothetical protein